MQDAVRQALEKEGKVQVFGGKVQNFGGGQGETPLGDDRYWHSVCWVSRALCQYRTSSSKRVAPYKVSALAVRWPALTERMVCTDRAYGVH
eukprot:1311776-Rhodomonas_salina.1